MESKVKLVRSESTALTVNRNLDALPFYDGAKDSAGNYTPSMSGGDWYMLEWAKQKSPRLIPKSIIRVKVVQSDGKEMFVEQVTHWQPELHGIPREVWKTTHKQLDRDGLLIPNGKKPMDYRLGGKASRKTIPTYSPEALRAAFFKMLSENLAPMFDGTPPTIQGK